jgi:hypothetical protein
MPAMNDPANGFILHNREGNALLLRDIWRERVGIEPYEQANNYAILKGN